VARIEKSIVIDAPVEKVFSYVEDPNNIPEYWPSVVEIKDVEELPNGGARMKAVYKMAGVRFDMESECTEFEPNQRTVYKSQGGVSSTATWIYAPHDGGTKVTIRNEYAVQLPVLRKLAESFLTKVNENEAETVLNNVKAKMEA
jgi:uncharacterized protein YndB with AHSA1/START domain